jgi:hypothetical protein
MKFDKTLCCSGLEEAIYLVVVIPQYYYDKLVHQEL